MRDRAGMPVKWGPTAAALALTAIAAAAAAGCGSSAHKTETGTPPTTSVAATAVPTSAPATTATTATSAPSTTLPATTVPTTTATTAPPAPAACTSRQIVVTLGSGGAGVGHEGIALLFKNVGSADCLLGGYPGVALLDAAGHQVTEAVRTPSGYLGGLPAGATVPVTQKVGPDQTVSALLEGTDVPTGNTTSCPSYPKLLVTPPNQTVATPLKLAEGSGSSSGFPGCSTPQIHPIVMGQTGREN